MLSGKKRRKGIVAWLVVVGLVLGASPVSFAAFYGGSATDLTIPNQAVLPSSSGLAVVRLTITATDAAPITLNSVDFAFNNVWGLLATDIARIEIYRDDGDGVYTRGGEGLPLASATGLAGILTPGNIIEAGATVHYWITYDTTVTIVHNDAFTITISGIVVDLEDRGISVTTRTITCTNNVTDVWPLRDDEHLPAYGFLMPESDIVSWPNRIGQLMTVGEPQAVIGINLGGDSYLERVRVHFTDVSNFDFADLHPWVGVQLYRDADGDGIFDPAIDTRLPTGPGWWVWPTVTLTLPGPGDRIPLTHDELDDYFIVIRPSLTMEAGDAFTVSVSGPGGNIKLSNGIDNDNNYHELDSFHPPRQRTRDIYALLSVDPLFDADAVTQGDLGSDLAGKFGHMEASSQPIPIFGLNLTDATGLRETLDAVTVTFRRVGAAFDPLNDLRPLADDVTSGVALYKDNKTAGRRGTFDAADTVVPLSVGTVNWTPTLGVPGKWQVTLSPVEGQDIPDNDLHTGDYRGHDFFVVIQTSAGIGYGTTFTAAIEAGDVNLSYDWHGLNTPSVTEDITANVPTLLRDLTSPGQMISASSAPMAVIGINVHDGGGDGPATAELKRITIYLDNPDASTDFTPWDLNALAMDITSGVALFRDMNGNGTFEAGVDVLVPLAALPYWGGGIGYPYNVTLHFDRASLLNDIPDTDTGLDAGDDFFVVIRTSDRISFGDDFKVFIANDIPTLTADGDIFFIDDVGTLTTTYKNITFAEANIITADSVTNTVFEDLTSPGQRIDALSSDDPLVHHPPLAIVGIDHWDGPGGTEKLQSLTVRVNDISNFNPNIDLAALTNNEFSGLSLYRDNGDGIFSLDDTRLSVSFGPWTGASGGPWTLLITLITPEDVPDAPDGNNDLFIVLRASESIEFNDRFTVGVNRTDLIYTAGPSNANIDLVTNIITANIPTFIFDLTLMTQPDPLVFPGLVINEVSPGTAQGEKTLSFTDIENTLTWDGGPAVAIPGDVKFLKLYDGGGVNYIVVSVNFMALEGGGDRSDIITITPGTRTIDPSSVRMALIGIDMADATAPDQTLVSLTLIFDGNPGFNPHIDFKPLTDTLESGVLIYRDTNNNGIFDVGDTRVDLDPLSSLTWSGARPYEVTLSFALPHNDIPATIDGFPDYFVVIQTSAEIANNDHFTVEIPVSGIICTDGSPARTRLTGRVTARVPLTLTDKGSAFTANFGPGFTNRLVLDFTINTGVADTLRALTVENTGDAQDGSDIGLVRLWRESGAAAGFQSGQDIEVATGIWNAAAGTWDFRNLDRAIEGTRFYVTVNIVPNPRQGRSLRFQIPILLDVNANEEYDVGDKGVFVASRGNGPLVAFINPSTQTIQVLRGDDLSAEIIPVTELGAGLSRGLALDFTITPDLIGQALHTLTIANLGTAQAITDILRLEVWTGYNPLTGTFSGLLGEAMWNPATGTWNLSGLNQPLPQRLYVSVDIVSQPVDLRTIQLSIPLLSDGGTEGRYDPGDRGIFMVHPGVEIGPTDAALISPSILTIHTLTLADITHGGGAGTTIFDLNSQNNLVLDFILDPDIPLDTTLTGLTVRNTGDAVSGTDITSVRLWRESGGQPGFQSSGAHQDTLVGPATWNVPHGYWHWTGLASPVEAEGSRFYVTADIAAGATEGRTIQMQIEQLVDVNRDGVLNVGEGDRGIFLASAEDGPNDGDFTNDFVQTLGEVPALISRETLDTDGDGQLDRIRVTADTDLNDDFTGLTITVVDGDYTYTVIGYCTGAMANDAIFYVHLQERGSGDTGATPTVQITANTTLGDMANVIIPVETSGIASIDTAGPVLDHIAYRDIDLDGQVDQIALVYSELIFLPQFEATDYTLGGMDSGGITISGGVANENEIQLTIMGAPAQRTSLALSLAYEATSGIADSIKDKVGLAAGSFAFTSLIDEAAPVILTPYTETVSTTSTTTIQIRLTEDIDAATLAVGDFTVVGHSLLGVTEPVAGRIQLILSPAMGTGDRPALTYTQGSLADTSGNLLASTSIDKDSYDDEVRGIMQTAQILNPTTIRVIFSERVSGTENPAFWSLSGGHTIIDIAGSGTSRWELTLQAPGIPSWQMVGVTYDAGLGDLYDTNDVGDPDNKIATTTLSTSLGSLERAIINDLTVANQATLPGSKTAVLGLDLADGGGLSLTYVTVRFTDVGLDYDFTINDISQVHLYADHPTQGISGQYDPQDIRLGSFSPGVDWPVVTLTVTPAPDIPPHNLGAYIGNDFFIIVETSATIVHGDDFIVTIGPGDILAGGFVNDSQASTNAITCVNRATDLWEREDFTFMMPESAAINSPNRIARLIDVLSAPEAVMGLDVGGTADIISIRVDFQEVGGSGFAPSDLADLNHTDEVSSGVALYRDDGDGVFGPGDTVVDLEAAFWVGLHQAQLILTTPETIPLTRDGRDDYFIVIRTSSTIGTGHTFNVALGYITFSNGIHNDLEPTQDISALLSINSLTAGLLADEAPGAGSHAGTRRLEALSQPTPILGLNVAGSIVETINYVKVTFTNISGFDPALDLRPLADNATSGVALYKDNKGGGIIGAWDVTDTLVPLNVGASTWSGSGPWTVTLIPTTGQEVYSDDRQNHRGDDYFIVIRTSSHIAYGDAFTATVPADGIRFSHRSGPSAAIITTDTIKANMPVVATDLTISGQKISASSAPTALIALTLHTNLAASSLYRLDRVVVSLESISGTPPITALKALTNDDTSGVLLYRDGNNDGEFDEADIRVPLRATPTWIGEAGEPYQIQFLPDPAHPASVIPQASDRPNFFIVIQTSDTISFGTQFRVFLGLNTNSYGPEDALFPEDPSGVGPLRFVYDKGGPEELATTSWKTTEAVTNTITISTTVLHNLVSPGQQIDATSEPTAVIGINTFDILDVGNTLEAITIDFTGIGFTPCDLAMLTNDATSGVAFYQDSAVAGIRGVFDIHDIFISMHTPEWSGTSVRLSFTVGVSLPPYDSGDYQGSDYFVVIRTSRTISYNDQFRVGVAHDGLMFSFGPSVADTDLVTETITARIPTFLHDVTPAFAGRISPFSESVAVIAINASDLIEGGGEAEATLSSVTVHFTGISGFTTDDLKPLSTGADSGVALYRDDGTGMGSVEGLFDNLDSVVTLASTPVWGGVGDMRTVTLIPAMAIIPDNDLSAWAGADFFVVIKTKNISHGDSFTVSIPIDGIIYSVGPSGETITTAIITGDITGNIAPTITLLTPPAAPPRTVIAPGGDFLIRWTDRDPDSDATINLYWDSDGLGYDGTLIVSGLSEDDHGLEGQYLWTGIPAGVYYIYARIWDGVNPPVYVYAEAPLHVNVAPTITVTAPPAGETPAVDTFRIEWTAVDLDDDATISIYFDTDSTGRDGILIVGGLSEDRSPNFYDWDITGVTAGIYYIYARIDDGINPPVYSYSLGTIRVSRRPTVTVIAPDGGEIWTADDTTNEITWIATDPDGDVLTIKIEYSLDGGHSWTALPATDAEGNVKSANDGLYVWDTSLIATVTEESSVLVRVTASDGIDEGFDTSDAPFTIDNRKWTISGRVWIDEAGGIDDVWDAGIDTPIAGVTVGLVTAREILFDTTAADGNYSIINVPRGSYMVRPSKAGYMFSPPSQLVAPSPANYVPGIIDVDFTATKVYGTITGITYNAATGEVTITWESSNIYYRIYYTDDFDGTGGEFTLATIVRGHPVDPTTSWTDDGSLTDGLPGTVAARFYMIRSDIGLVPSPNTVGIFRIIVSEGMNLISLPLVPMAGDYSLDTVIGSQLRGGPDAASADRIWKWDSLNQSYSYAWLNFVTDTWYTNVAPTTLTLAADEGAWVQVRPGHGTQDIFVVGEVSGIDRSLTIHSGMNLIGSSFPLSVALVDSNLKESGATGAHTAARADRVWRWNSITQSYSYAWLVDGVGAPYDGKWYTDNVETTITLDPGQGFWFQRRDGSFNWDYLKRYDHPPNE